MLSVSILVIFPFQSSLGVRADLWVSMMAIFVFVSLICLNWVGSRLIC